MRSAVNATTLKRMYRSLQERVDDAFAEGNTAAELAYGEAYLGRLADGVVSLANRDARTVALVVALIAVSFPFSGAKTSEVELGPFHLSDVSGVLTLVPAMTSYLYYELTSTVRARNLYQGLLSAVAHRLYPKIEETTWS